MLPANGILKFSSRLLSIRAGIVAEVDKNGQVLHLFQDPTVKAYWISEAEIHEGYMYLGSWRTPFLARAKIAPAGKA